MAALEQLSLALWQEHLDGRLPGKPMLRPDEVAAFLGTDAKTIARIFDREVEGSAPLIGVGINAAEGERMHRRIMRDSVILYWATHANYTPDEFRARIVEVLGTCSSGDLVLIQAAIAELLRRRA